MGESRVGVGRRWRKPSHFNLCCVTEITAKPRGGMAAITRVVGKWEPDTSLRDRRVFGATMERNAKHPKCPLHSVQLQIL